MLLVWQVNCLYYSFSAITCLYHLLWLAYTLHCSFSLAIYLIKRFVIILHSFTNFLTTSRISSDETIGWSRICIEIDFWGVQFNSKWNRTREREKCIWNSTFICLHYPLIMTRLGPLFTHATTPFQNGFWFGSKWRILIRVDQMRGIRV